MTLKTRTNKLFNDYSETLKGHKYVLMTSAVSVRATNWLHDSYMGSV